MSPRSLPVILDHGFKVVYHASAFGFNQLYSSINYNDGILNCVPHKVLCSTGARDWLLANTHIIQAFILTCLEQFLQVLHLYTMFYANNYNVYSYSHNND